MDKNVIIVLLILVLILALFTNNKNNLDTENFEAELPWVQNSILPEYQEQEVDTEFVEKVNTKPYIVSILSKSGNNKIAINSINGFKIGDIISINPNNNTAESNTVIGIGNGILLLNKTLEYDHKPNEYIYNMSNDKLKYNDNLESNSSDYYAYIDNSKINYNSTLNPWG